MKTMTAAQPNHPTHRLLGGALFLGVALVMGAGCAGSAYLAGQRKPLPVGPGVNHQEGSFEGKGGVRLFEQSWQPQGSPAKAVLIIVHGLKDHSDRYAAVAERLVARGYAVHAFDLRGHGDSEGDRVWVSSFDDYLDDLALFVARVQQAEPGRPLFLFGHSMGGAIVTLFTLARAPQLRGLVLSGAALNTDRVSGFLRGTTKVLGSIAPTLAVLKLDDEAFSRDPAVISEMKADPLVYDGAGPARTAKELLKAVERIQKRMEALAVPLLALHGGADAVTNPEGSRQLVQRARSTDKTLKIYDGLFHDLLHEPEKDKVTSDLCDWLDARVEHNPAR